MPASLRSIPLFLAAVAAAQQPGLFDYDRSIPFQYNEEAIRSEPAFEVVGAGMQSPRGGKVNMLVVRPRGKGPFAGIVFQHGGGQSILTYLPEAELLARAGALSLILDAPGNRDRKPEDQMTGAELRDYYAEIVICERRAMDYLESLGTVGRTRIAYVGHSYGGIMDGVLTAVEPRFGAFVLIGAIPRYSEHVATSPADFWVRWRKQFAPDRLDNETREVRSVDPDRYIRDAKHGPLLMQCGNFDFDNSAGCVELFQIAPAPKEVRWYDTDHGFLDIEAMIDRVQWLGAQLHLKNVGAEVQHLLSAPRKQTQPLKVR